MSQPVVYTRASVAMGNGELLRATSLSVTVANQAKQVHTLRQDGDGIFFGPVECSGSFGFSVPAEGIERDYISMCEKKKIKQFRFKIPGKTITVNGAVASVEITSQTDQEITGTVNFIGRKQAD